MLPPTPPPFPHLVALSAVLLSSLAARASAAPSPTATHAAVQPAPTAPALAAPIPEQTPAQQQPGLHLPLHRRNGHLHHLSRRSRAEQEDIVRSWAVRERGRLLGKYGQSEARLRRRDGGGAAAESPGDDDGAGADRVRRGRRRGLDGVEDGGADLERRQIGVGNALSSRTTATTGTAFSTAGFGTATSGSESDSESSTSTGTRTAPTRIPTQSSSVGEVHLVNYDADLCVALSLVTPRSGSASHQSAHGTAGPTTRP